MRLEIDIPEHHYNNIMSIDSISLGRMPYKGIIMYTINAIKHGKVLEQEPQTFKWCTDCKEYDQEKHCCHRWSKVIRNAVKELEQEPKTDIKLTNSEWVDFLCKQFDISRTSAKEMLHVMMSVKKENNFKKQFSGRK